MLIFIDDKFYFSNDRKVIFSINSNFVDKFEEKLRNFLNQINQKEIFTDISNIEKTIKDFRIDLNDLFSNIYILKNNSISDGIQKEQSYYKSFEISKPFNKHEKEEIKKEIINKINNKDYKKTDENLDFLELSQSKFILEEIINNEKEIYKKLKEILDNYFEIIIKDLKNISFDEKINNNKENLKLKLKKQVQIIKEKEIFLKDLNSKIDELKIKLEDLTKKEDVLKKDIDKNYYNENQKKIDKLNNKIIKIKNKMDKENSKIQNLKTQIEIYKIEIEKIKSKIKENKKHCVNIYEILLSFGLIYFLDFGKCKKKGKKLLLKITNLEEKILKLKQKINSLKSEESKLNRELNFLLKKTKEKKEEKELELKINKAELNIINQDKKKHFNMLNKYQKKKENILISLNDEKKILKELELDLSDLENLNLLNIKNEILTFLKKIYKNIHKNQDILNKLKEQRLEIDIKNPILIEIKT